MRKNTYVKMATVSTARQQQPWIFIVLALGLSIGVFLWFFLITPTPTSQEHHFVSLKSYRTEPVDISTVFAPRPFLQTALQQAAPLEVNNHQDNDLPVPGSNTLDNIGQHIQKFYGMSQKHLSYAMVHIKHSLHKDAHNAGLPAKLVAQLRDIFKEKINLNQALRRGDSLSILYQKSDKKSSESNIVAAKLLVKGKDYSAISYTDASGHKGYYTPAGVSLQTSFLRTPLRYKHISSGFTNARKHPILNIVRPHKGIDFAAPLGTPIKAAGYGKIVYSNQKSGYGKTVIIKHDHKYSTLYAHLSRIAKGIKPGKHIEEGQVIGYVGHSGYATGSHLHYEFHVNGVAHDPLSVELPRNTVPETERHKFTNYVQMVTNQLGNYQKVLLASNTSKIDL